MNIINLAYAAATVQPTTKTATTLSAEQAAENVNQASEGILSSLGLNPTLFIFQLINFAIVALIIWFLVLKPLIKKMAERQDKITASLIKAEEVDANLRKSEQKYQEKIDMAKAEAAKILARAQIQAKEIGDKLKEKSKQEIELLVEQAKKNIRIEKQEMLSEIKIKAGELVVAVMEKILEEKIDNKKDKEMILRSVKNVKI